MNTITSFFLQHIYLEYGLRIFISLVFGSLLGYERKLRRQIVGMRTLVMISVSSTLMSILSIEMAHDLISEGDPTRIAAGVITGIGFVGGGAIMKHGLNIKGLTTAAIIFATAGIGLACGAGLYIPCTLAFIVILFSFFVMEKFEHKVFPMERTKILTVKFSGSAIDDKKIEDILTSHNYYVADVNIEYKVKENQSTLKYTVRIPHKADSIKLATDFSRFENLIDFTLSEN